MNHLTRQHLELIKAQYDQELYSTISIIKERAESLAEKSTEVTAEVATSFALWLWREGYELYTDSEGNQYWGKKSELATAPCVKTPQLFNKFLDSFYTRSV